MTMDDYWECFQYYCIGVHHDEWHTTTHGDKNEDKKSVYLDLIVPDDTDIYLRLHLHDNRFYGELGRDLIPYPAAEFIISKQEKDGTFRNLVSDPKDLHYFVSYGDRTLFPSKHHSFRLKEGQYKIRVKVYWSLLPPEDWVVSAFSEKKTEIKKSEKEPENFIVGTIKNAFKQNMETDKVDKRENNCNVYEGKCGAHTYLAFVNSDSKLKWTCTVTFS
mmetsp:Transcript_27390/g.24149  ORF Transcript_27390/g.24149 Transcript_27390/m.24149 type:complete len:218 (+) Transcript_27390:968-1621(+)